MKKYKNFRLGLIISGALISSSLYVSNANAGSFGAEIFCTMRDGGNDHESSWEAAYSYIKRQKGGLFKISPKQAAAQIVETVVREREKFSFCVEYLNKLHPDRELQREAMKMEKENAKKEKEQEARRKKIENLIEKDNEDLSTETFNRYSY